MLDDIKHFNDVKTPPLKDSEHNFYVSDSSTGRQGHWQGKSYTGPVDGIDHSVITITTDNVNILAEVPNTFIKTGSGNDTIQTIRGNNILDGGSGSNYLTGGTGFNTFFIDNRNPKTDMWSTIINAHSGDNITIWGLTKNDFTTWTDNEGAAGGIGLTLHAKTDGRPQASLTLAGFTTNDLNNGKLTYMYGTTSDKSEAVGSNYLNIHIN